MRTTAAVTALMLLTVILLSVMPVMAESQDQYLVYGYVFDEDGAAVLGAVVTVENKRTGDTINTVSDGSGKYLVSLLDFESGYQDGDILIIEAEKADDSGSVSADVVEGEVGEKVDVTFGIAAAEDEDEDEDRILGLDPAVFWLILILVVAVIIGVVLFVIYSRQQGNL